MLYNLDVRDFVKNTNNKYDLINKINGYKRTALTDVFITLSNELLL